MTQSPGQISYEPVRSRLSGLGGGIALLFAGLGMILLGGCFLIGILMLFSTPFPGAGTDPAYWPLALTVLPWMLYTLAGGCFIGAIFLIAGGVRWLYTVGR